MKTREQLLQEISDERAQWQALLAEVGEDRMEEPGPMGDWTFKDLAAHLLAWRERTLARLAAGPGGNTQTPWPDTLTTDDEINEWIHEQHRDRPLSDVLADVDQSYERLANLVAGMPEEVLMTPGYFGFEGMENTALVDLDFFGHLHEEHEPAIREWLQSR
jgi:uncharacterized protein (TIGR03083 family)